MSIPAPEWPNMWLVEDDGVRGYVFDVSPEDVDKLVAGGCALLAFPGTIMEAINALFVLVEHKLFKPLTEANRQFHVTMFMWEGTPFVLVGFPEEHLSQVETIAAQYQIQIIPYPPAFVPPETLHAPPGLLPEDAKVMAVLDAGELPTGAVKFPFETAHTVLYRDDNPLVIIAPPHSKRVAYWERLLSDAERESGISLRETGMFQKALAREKGNRSDEQSE